MMIPHWPTQPEEGEGHVSVKDQALLAAWDAKLGGAVEDLIKMVRT